MIIFSKPGFISNFYLVAENRNLAFLLVYYFFNNAQPEIKKMVRFS